MKPFKIRRFEYRLNGKCRTSDGQRVTKTTPGAVKVDLGLSPEWYGNVRAADGLLGVMGCPRPPSPRRLYAGADALAVDIVAGGHLGLKDPKGSTILRTACHWFGDPSGRIQVFGPDQPIAGWRSPYHTDLSTLLSFLAYPMYQFGSGRGALFVPEMDEAAFPPLRPEPAWLRLARRTIRSLLGLRHSP